MRVLYGVQGTGNGHLSRAREIIPHLAKKVDLDILISGSQVDISIAHHVAHRLYGLSYSIGRAGNIDMFDTVRKLKPIQLINDVMQLPVQEYDLIINDFEPVSAWAGKLKGVPVVALSHQAAFLSDKVPRPDQQTAYAEFLFRTYAPSSSAVGFHFEKYDDFIHHPIIRSEVRALNPVDGDHITVYLPAYESNTLIELFKQLKEIRWEVFNRYADKEVQHENVTIRPVSSEAYLKSLESSAGLLTGGGFEAPSEALFLGKMLMVVPMMMQYEQQCNAAALHRMGINSLDRIDKNTVQLLKRWLGDSKKVKVDYKDETAQIIENIL